MGGSFADGICPSAFSFGANEVWLIFIRMTLNFEWKRTCSDCGKKLFYSRKDGKVRANKKNALCSICGSIGEHNNFYGHHHSLDTNQKNREKHFGKKQSEASIHKMMVSFEKSKYKRKLYVLPNGQTVLIQGYENWTLDKLINEEKVPFESIKGSINEKPKIKYQFLGKNCWYYPDCYLSNSNTIIETKSNYTWNYDLDKNKSKLKAAKNSGYNVRLVVWGKKP